MFRFLLAIPALLLLLACEHELEGAACPCGSGFACCELLDVCFRPTHECIVRQNQARDAGAGDAAAETAHGGAKLLPQHCNASGFCGARYPFRALHGAGDDDIWAVSQDPTDGDGASLMHFDGSRWDNYPYYANTSYYQVRAVHSPRPGHTWFVGDDGGLALAFQFLDGAFGPVWNFGELGALHAVYGAAEDDVWAAGAAGAVTRWNGEGWTTQSTPATATLLTAHGTGSDDVWFAGEAGTVLHYAGGAFHLEPSPSRVTLRAVFARAPDDVWFAGDDATLLHFDGTALRVVDHGTGGDVDFTTLAGDARRLVIGRNDGRLVELREGEFALRDERLRSAARGLWVSPQDVLWAVGDIGDSLRLHDGTLVTSPAPFDDHLRDVWGATKADLWAVGEGGAMLHGDGVAFTRIDSVTRDALYALDGTGPDDVWAVGERAILHFDGVIWRAVAESPSPLRDVRALSVNSAWAVGDEGLIMRWDGTRFAEFERREALSLRTVWGMAEDDVWAFDQSSACLRWDGLSWRDEPTFGPGLNDVRIDQVAVGSAQDDMWLLKTYDSQGTRYLDSALYMGVTFEQREATEWYTAIRRGWPSGRRDFWLVGDGFWHFSAGDMDYRYAYFGLDWPLHGVWAEGMKVWAVGDYGVMLHYEEPVYADVGDIGE